MAKTELESLQEMEDRAYALAARLANMVTASKECPQVAALACMKVAIVLLERAPIDAKQAAVEGFAREVFGCDAVETEFRALSDDGKPVTWN